MQKDKVSTNNTDSVIVVQSKSVQEFQKNISDIHYDIHKATREEKPTFFGASYDTVFTVSVTIFIFFIGILIDRILKHRNEKSELEDLRSYFFDQLRDLANRIGPNLLKGFKQYYQKEITVDKGIPTTPPKILTNNLERIRKMESEKLFKALTPQEKKDFNKYFNEIDFVSNLLKEIDEYHSIILRRSEIVRNKISELDNLYMMQLLNFVRMERINVGENSSFYILALEKMKYYNEEIAGKRNLTNYYKKVIEPIQAKLAQHEHAHINFIHDTLNTGKLLKHNYYDLKLIVIEVRLQYREFSLAISRSLNRLNDLV